jgi:hypothetical protein
VNDLSKGAYKGPNECKVLVDELHGAGQKLCHWDEALLNHVVCKVTDHFGECGGECSNANPSNLGRYALCDGSDVCGLDYLIIDDGGSQKLRSKFTRKDQVCVYKVVHLGQNSRSMFTLRARTLKYVEVELFSRVVGSTKSKFYKEGDISNEATYQPKFYNPEQSPED